MELWLLNPIENLQSVMNMKSYESDKHYNCNADPWKAIKTLQLKTEPSKVKFNKMNR